MNIIKIIISFMVIVLVMILVSFKPIEDKVEIDVEEVLGLPTVSDLINDEIRKLEQERLEEKREQEKAQAEELERRKREDNRSADVVSRGVDKGIFTATAYDLSVASCGKTSSHPSYGITANGTDLKGHTLESARAIAVDPKVIKLGSKVYIEFLDEDYKHLDGEYVAVDTGGAIKGKIIDVFFGSGDVAEEVKQFGRRKIKIKVIIE